MTTRIAPVIITIDGNIGSGKSTLIRELHEKYKSFIAVLEEPLDDKLLKLLKQYYNDPITYSYLFQYKILKNKYNHLKRLVEECGHYKIIIMERSFRADKECFFDHYFEGEYISNKQYEKYMKLYNKIIIWYDSTFKNIPTELRKNNVQIYLESLSIEELLRRIMVRKRPGEDCITNSYLAEINRKYAHFSFDCIIGSPYTLQEASKQILEIINTKCHLNHGLFTFNGSIEVIMGPMFAGKTTQLIRKLCELDSDKILCINHRTDTRYTAETREMRGSQRTSSQEWNTSCIVSHDLQSYASISSGSELINLLKTGSLASYDIIATDEGQFFTDIVGFAEFCSMIGKTVLIATLNTTFLREPFGDIGNLCAIATNIIHLHSKCAFCESPAPFTIRVSDAREKIVIGGGDIYKPVCQYHYLVRESSEL